MIHSMGEKYQTSPSELGTHHVNLSSIISKLSLVMMGNIPTVREVVCALRTKISWGLITPYTLTRGVFHFSLQILVMPESSATLLVHMVEHLHFLSSAQSFWFMLDTSYDYGCHLAN
jgi:hypothetical protein